MPEDKTYHVSPSDLRRLGHAAIDWIANYHERVESLPVLSHARPGEIRTALPAHPPERGERFEEVLKNLDRVILPGITHWQSPNFFAYFPANASGPAILGDLISSGLGVQGMLWATSPACTELETHVLDWMAETWTCRSASVRPAQAAAPSRTPPRTGGDAAAGACVLSPPGRRRRESGPDGPAEPERRPLFDPHAAAGAVDAAVVCRPDPRPSVDTWNAPGGASARRPNS